MNFDLCWAAQITLQGFNTGPPADKTAPVCTYFYSSRNFNATLTSVKDINTSEANTEGICASYSPPAGGMVVQCLVLSGSGFEHRRADWGPSVWSLHVLCVYSSYFGFQSNPKTCRLIGDSKLAVVVNVSVSGCQSLYVGPVTDCCSPNTSWDRLQHPHDPVKDKRYRKWKMHGWTHLQHHLHCQTRWRMMRRDMLLSWMPGARSDHRQRASASANVGGAVVNWRPHTAQTHVVTVGAGSLHLQVL